MPTLTGISGIFAAGVTGGHIYPALAVADEMRNQIGLNAVFVGTGRGAEPRIFKNFPYGYKKIGARGSDVSKIVYLYKNSAAMLKSLILLRRFKPDFVFTTGGYIGGIVGYAAHLLKIPLYVHESNVDLGISVKKLIPYAKRTFCAFEAASQTIENGLFVGTPTRKEFKLPKDPNFREDLGIGEGKTVVLSFGGSEGSDTIDGMVSELSERMPDHVFIHIGRNFSGRENVIHFDYFNDMAYLMRNSDVVVSRAGASTIAEIISCSKPSIIVPWKGSLNSHQESNAKHIEDAGGGFMIDEDEISVDDVAKIFEKLSDSEVYRRMSENLERLNPRILPAKEVVRVILGDLR